MGQHTSAAPGRFAWMDLGVPDVEAAAAFYGRVLGWTTRDGVCRAGELAVAGMYGDPAPPLGVPVWSHHVSVTDTEATAARAVDLGAEVVGKGTLRDPEGARISLRAGGGAELVDAPGALVLSELGTRDPDAARRFYGALFGWTFASGADGRVSIHTGAAPDGAMRTIWPQEGSTPAHWMPYFGVADLDAAGAAVTEAGGQVLAGPIDTGAGRALVVKDPQRTPLALRAGPVDP